MKKIRVCLKPCFTLEFILGFTLTFLLGSLVCFSGLIFPDGGSVVNLDNRLLKPFVDSAHFLGTDVLGRDVLARVVVGGKVSYIIGIVSTLGSVLIGTIVGLFAGYYRGFLDTFIMRFVDVQLAFPFILLAITVIAIMGPGLDRIIIVMIITQWVQYARLVRGSVLSLREREYVQAAQSYGLHNVKIIFTHILPNVIGPIIVLITLNIANNILLESSLTFLGLGIIEYPSWGGMLADGRQYMQTAWWLMVFPGLSIMLSVLGFNLLGDWLRNHLDPLTRKR